MGARFAAKPRARGDAGNVKGPEDAKVGNEQAGNE
jgi:hypothetical protein